MERNKFLAKARAAIKQRTISTPALADYIGAWIDTPLGQARIDSINKSHTRKINGSTYTLYTINVSPIAKPLALKRIVAYDFTQWIVY